MERFRKSRLAASDYSVTASDEAKRIGYFSLIFIPDPSNYDPEESVAGEGDFQGHEEMEERMSGELLLIYIAVLWHIH